MDSTDVLIIGGGPAGLSAGIYSVRNGLKTLIIEKNRCGGLAMEAPLIENYPGFESIEGIALMDKIKSHASRYVDIHELETVDKVRLDKQIIIKTDKDEYTSSGLIFATGTTHSKLGIAGESEFTGKGVSYCATCDGFLFKGKKVLVVGGGNTAVVDAIHLKNIGCEVKVIHRRDELRAEESLQKTLLDSGIDVIWNSVVEEIRGNDVVTEVIIRNRKDDKIKELKVDGVFISVGEKPNSELTKEIGVKLDEHNFIITDKRQCTNVAKVYGAGDVTGGVKQIVVACAEGAIAASSAYQDIKHPYWV